MPKNWIAGPQNPVGPEPRNPGAAKYPNFVKRSGPERWLRQWPSEGTTPPAGGGGGTGGGGGGTIATATTPGIVKPGTGMTVAADGTITYTLSPATALALGGVKQGTNIVIAPDGTISANLPGAVNFRGITDVTVAPTATYDPTTAQRGDMWIASTTGTANAAWTGLTTVTKDAMIVYDGAKWDISGDVGGNVKPDWAAAAGAADEILNKPNVLPKSDWTAVPGDPAEILNKPTIPGKPDWTATAGAADEILNKPTTFNYRGMIRLTSDPEPAAVNDVYRIIGPIGATPHANWGWAIAPSPPNALVVKADFGGFATWSVLSNSTPLTETEDTGTTPTKPPISGNIAITRTSVWAVPPKSTPKAWTKQFDFDVNGGTWT